ncbi:hypothetical protein FHY35_004047 [Xanthomonas arboricola]|uniref:hypothetical protein n=1 Tax=Xanthomonas arboricola TaxID=56448 RepID=UPI00141A7BA2|nr:hypothetical protein [Xanthomonas arboricola]NIJ86997.1 hypothetical protein [Xanthomonas arboricola]
MVNQLAQFSPLDAATYVQQQGEMGRQRGQQNKLAQLASQSYSAPADQQSQLLGQMAAIDPKAAQTQQTQFESAEDRRNKTLANMSNLLVNAPEQARPGLYQQMLPTLKQFGVDAPAAYDATTSPVIDQTARALYTAYSGADGKTPTDVRSFQLMTAGLSPEDREKARRVQLGIEGRASTSGFTQVKFTGPDGRERIGVMNGRTGQIDLPDGTSFNPQTGAMAVTQGGGGMVQPQPTTGTVFRTSTGELFDVSKVTEPALRAEIMANPAAYGMLPDGAQATLPPRIGAPNAFVGRAPEEQAAATAAAQRAVELGTLAPELQMRTQDAVQRAGATTAVEASAKQRVEQEGQSAKRSRDGAEVLSLLAQAEKILPKATGSRLGQLGDAAAAVFGTSTEGAQATAQLQTIAGQLTSKMPRMEGPQSNSDVILYQQMAGDLANASLPIETRLAALKTIRELNQKYANQQPAPADNNAPVNSGGSYSNLWN